MITPETAHCSFGIELAGNTFEYISTLLVATSWKFVMKIVGEADVPLANANSWELAHAKKSFNSGCETLAFLSYMHVYKLCLV